jgi:hypothetical protein
MAQFKGTVFLGTRIFTERAFGPGAVERCLSRLSASERAVLEGVTAIGWCPVEPVLRYHHVLEEVFGRPGAFEVSERAGKFSAEWAMNTVLKLFVRFKSPHWLMGKHGAVWGRYHDSGRWEIAPEQPHRLSGRLFDFQVRDEAFCARLRGWLDGAVHLTGGKSVRVLEPACRCRGASACQFDVEWE